MGLFSCILYRLTSFHTICININIFMKQKLSLLPPLSHNIYHFHISRVNGTAFEKQFTSFRQFKKIINLTLIYSQYIISLLLFVVKNRCLYTANQEINDINTT